MLGLQSAGEELMTDTVILFAEIREEFGTGPSRALRNNGRIPAIIYGRSNKEPIAISLEEKEITKYYRKPNFISSVIQLEIGKKKHKVLPKAVELHPIKDTVHHIDFVHLSNDVQKMPVPIVFEGKERAIGVKRGGFFNIVKRTITLLCDVNNIPKNITIDVSNMYVGQSLKVSNLNIPEGCTLTSKTDSVIASIIGSRGSKSEEEEKPAS